MFLEGWLGQSEFWIAGRAGITFLDYLQNTWMSSALWLSWSLQGHLQAAALLGVPVDSVIPTTNHLESFNGILKNTYIKRWQRGRKQVRYDLLIFLLVG
jgi:hypothetical protein